MQFRKFEKWPPLPKCSIIHADPHYECECIRRINHSVLCSGLSFARNLGIWFVANARWNICASTVGSEPMKIASLILRTLHYKSLFHFKTAFISYCRPLLEYGTQMWFPDAISELQCVENFQIYFTRIAFSNCILGPYSPSYCERHEIFDLKSFEYRHVEFDLIRCRQIVDRFTLIRFDDLFSWAAVQVEDKIILSIFVRKCC